jgi:cilia- and flagella-associated protein 57
MPFNGDIVEYPACSGPVSRIRISYDDTLLFVAGTDGSLLVFEIRDKDGRLPHREGSVAVPFSEEVLVTRSDLEDRATSIAELRDAVDELQSNNDYANRMRDIAFQERLKKLTERYTTELDHNREQYDLLREEKLDVEHEFSERLKVMEMSHQSEMQKRESLYQSACHWVRVREFAGSSQRLCVCRQDHGGSGSVSRAAA